ncbi:MAG: sulfotransferase [Phycisphaeraceae bacterium]
MIPYRAQQAVKHIKREAAVLCGMCHIDTHELSGTVLLAGSGRSGTTWMSQIINHGNVYRDIFEPFHPQHVEQVANWPAMRYLPSKQRNNEINAIVESLLAGRVRSRWTDAYNRKQSTKQRLVKAIRTNLMLGFIRESLPQVKLLFAMRHPCAVVHSRMKLRWETHLDQLLAQPALMEDHLEPYRDTIERFERSDDTWTKHMTMWCVENVVPMRELKSGDAHLVRYEDLCTDFDREVGALFAFLGRSVPSGIEQAAQKRSAHYRHDSAILHGGDLISDWQRHVEPQQIDTMLRLLSEFDLSHLYDEKPNPCCSRDEVYSDAKNVTLPGLSRKEAA